MAQAWQHANARLTPRQRRAMVDVVVVEGWSVAAAAERFQVDAKTARKWRTRPIAATNALHPVPSSDKPASSPTNAPANAATRPKPSLAPTTTTPGDTSLAATPGDTSPAALAPVWRSVQRRGCISISVRMWCDTPDSVWGSPKTGIHAGPACRYPAFQTCYDRLKFRERRFPSWSWTPRLRS